MTEQLLKRLKASLSSNDLDTAIEKYAKSVEVREGRLLRKIEKLKMQRDHWKKQHDYYAEVISMQPYLERRHKSFTEMKQEIQRVKDLETRVKEQAKLIELLTTKTHPVKACISCGGELMSDMTNTCYACNQLKD